MDKMNGKKWVIENGKKIFWENFQNEYRTRNSSMGAKTVYTRTKQKERHHILSYCLFSTRCLLIYSILSHWDLFVRVYKTFSLRTNFDVWRCATVLFNKEILSKGVNTVIKRFHLKHWPRRVSADLKTEF